jgi:hypothetical protein
MVVGPRSREKAMRRDTSKTEAVAIYQLKITLEAIRPPIWRRVQVPGTILLPHLHRLIQAVMGWDDAHLHAFQVGDTSYGQPDSELDDWMQDERRIRLAQIAPAEKSKFRYEYDFGDDWRHMVVVEKILPVAVGQIYPVCLAGKRACPPEDCGGPWGYPEFLEAISNPKHEQHDELLEWIGGEFDPEAFDMAAVNGELQTMHLNTH